MKCHLFTHLDLAKLGQVRYINHVVIPRNEPSPDKKQASK